MKAIRTDERYTLCEDGIFVEVDIFLAESDVQIARLTRHKKVEQEGEQKSLPPNIAGRKSYDDGTTGFIREDGSMFFLMGGDTVNVKTLDEVIDLGFNHYFEAWFNHAHIPAGEAA